MSGTLKIKIRYNKGYHSDEFEELLDVTNHDLDGGWLTINYGGNRTRRISVDNLLWYEFQSTEGVEDGE